jgi:hypothetical protein
MDRKTPGGDDVMRYLSGRSTYPWKTMITLNLTEIENHPEVGTQIAVNHVLMRNIIILRSLSSVRLIMLMSQSH